MHNIFLRLIKPAIFILLVICLYNCKKVEIDQTNHFKIDDKVFEIKKCAIFKHYNNEVPNLLSINFYDNQIEYSQTDTGILLNSMILDGLNVISFQSSTLSDTIENGKHEIIDHYQSSNGSGGYGYPYKSDQVYLGTFWLNYKHADDIFEKYILIKSGEISINKNGNNCLIQFSSIGTDGSKMSGYFKGICLEYHDYSNY